MTEFTEDDAPSPPSVFISSTYYDLRNVREELDPLLRELGYLPVLFEEAGAIPNVRAAHSAIRHASHADICLLILGSRYGSRESADEISFTHAEYRTARDLGRPIFTFIERETLTKYELSQSRPDNSYWTDEEKSLFGFITEISAWGPRFPFATLPELKRSIRFQLSSYFGYLIRKYAQIDQIQPDTANGWNSLGVRLAERGEYGKSILAYRKALEMDPDYQPALGNLVGNLRRMARYIEANKECEKALGMYPHSPALRRLQALILVDLGDEDGGLQKAEQLVKDYPNDDRAWATLSGMYRLRGRPHDALNAIRKSLEIDPGDIDRYHRMIELERIVNIESRSAPSSEPPRNVSPSKHRGEDQSASDLDL